MRVFKGRSGDHCLGRAKGREILGRMTILVLLVTATLFTRISWASPVQGLATGNLHALVVGVSKYKDERIPELNLSSADATAFGRFLKSQDNVFKNAHVKVMLNDQATKEAIERYLYYELPTEVRKDDTIILFFSGHGEADPLRPKDFFFLPHDADPEYIRTKAVKMSGLEFLEGLDAQRVLLIADACYSGGFSRDGTKSIKSPLANFLESVTAARGTAVMTSSTDGQQSWEPPGFSNSVFTYHLLEGLKGRADKDHNGVVNLQEAYDYAYRQTSSSTRGMQKPVLVHSRVVGGFPISYVGKAPPRRQLAKALFQAIELGNTERVQELLDARSDIIDFRDSGNRTGLLLAAKNGALDMVKLLLGRGAEPSIKSDTGMTPLMWAVSNGHVEVVRLLLAGNVNLARRDSRGNSLLMAAARNGHKELVKILLDRGSNILARNQYGSTALSIAAYKGHVEIVSLLLESGAEIDSIDKSGRTPLTLAARHGRREVANLLLKKGAAIEKLVGASGTAPRSQATLALFKAMIQGDTQESKRLISNGAGVDSTTESGHTPLILAASLGHTGLVELLLNLGADIDAKTENESTAIKWAANNGWLETVRALWKRGAGTHIRDKWLATPLMYASQNGHTEIVRILANKAPIADINAKSARGNTALTLASAKGFTEVARILLDKGASVHDRTGEAALSGATPLILAASNGRSDLVKMLIERGADVDAARRDGHNALTLAAMNGRADVVEILLEAKADPNSVDSHGASALALASKNGHADVVRLLLDTGEVKTELRDWEGMSAMMWAQTGNHEKVVAMLESADSQRNNSVGAQ
jgi:ankyrin repeat protein